MTINLGATIHRGVNIAWRMVNPHAPASDFHDWLGATMQKAQAEAREEGHCSIFVEELHALCEGAVNGASGKFSDESDEDQDALLTAYRALSGIVELQALAVLNT